MAFVPDHRYDVFISYAWVNNQPPDENDPDSGWITRFMKRLKKGLDEKLGRIGSSEFFFDQSIIERTKDFNPQIEEALRKSAIVVAFFSDGYLASDACRQELRMYHEFAGPLSDSGRLFLVHVDEVAKDRWPTDFHTYLKNILGYRFYRKAMVRGTTSKLEVADREFTDEFESLRRDLKKRLEELKEEQTATVAEPAEREPRPTVLVAQSTPDLRKERKALVSNCESTNLRVLPEKNWPAAPGEFRQAFDEALEHAHVFVQLLSDCYSDRTEEFPDGIEAFQYQQAANKSGLTVLQWRDGDVDLTDVDDAHLAFITAPDVRSSLPAVFHKDVVDQTRRAFEIQRDAKHGAGQPDASKLVLLKADPADAEPTNEIVQSLTAANILCRVARNGVPMVERLRAIPFDALIVVLGECPDDWIEDRGDELMAVDLNFKDQVPLRVYCHCGSRQTTPPYVGREMLQVVAPGELDRLIQAIRQQGGDS